MPEITLETFTIVGGQTIPLIPGRSAVFFPLEVVAEVDDIVFAGGDAVSYEGAAVTKV